MLSAEKYSTPKSATVTPVRLKTMANLKMLNAGVKVNQRVAFPKQALSGVTPALQQSVESQLSTESATAEDKPRPAILCR